MTDDEQDAEEWVRDLAKRVRRASSLKEAVTILEDALDEFFEDDDELTDITIVFAGERVN